MNLIVASFLFFVLFFQMSNSRASRMLWSKKCPRFHFMGLQSVWNTWNQAGVLPLSCERHVCFDRVEFHEFWLVHFLQFKFFTLVWCQNRSDLFTKMPFYWVVFCEIIQFYKRHAPFFLLLLPFFWGGRGGSFAISISNKFYNYLQNIHRALVKLTSTCYHYLRSWFYSGYTSFGLRRCSKADWCWHIVGSCHMCLVSTWSFFFQWWKDGASSWDLEYTIQFICEGLKSHLLVAAL